MAKLNTSDFVKNLETMAVAMKAQGHETSVRPIDYPAITVTGWLIYGCRRWFQDSINSIAKNHRDNNEKFSGKDLFNARNEMALKGEWGSRGTGSGLDAEIVIMLNADLKESTGSKVWGKMNADKQDEARIARWEGFLPEAREHWMERATARKEIKAAAKAAIAALDVEVEI